MALVALGQGPFGTKTFQIRHLRTMAKSPRHLSHETNQELYLRLGVKECWAVLLDFMNNRVTALMQQSKQVQKHLASLGS